VTFGFRRPVALINGTVAAAEGWATSLRFGDRVLGLDDPPRPGDVVVDLAGAWVLPGLVNAHDHLELNHYGRLLGGAPFANAREWIDHLRPQLRDNAAIRANQRFALRDRLFVGALKNLLAGVTFVAHHNPSYGELRRLPVRVLDRFGWAHSYGLQGHPVGAHGEPGPDVAGACRATPADVPFIVHAGEGVDAEARNDLTRLANDGCLLPNTVIVHGVALTDPLWSRIVAAGASVVWCPASNLGLLGATANVAEWIKTDAAAARHLCLATDSRLTGSRDLLDELTVARDASGLSADILFEMVTTSPAAILRTGCGSIRVGGAADLTIVPGGAASPGEALIGIRRADVSCVIVGGEPMVGHPAMGPIFSARRAGRLPLRVDGSARIASSRLHRMIATCSIAEPGVKAEQN
jgi:cytosine/adenosine deaminase-related metal-dependent hydrolase